MIRKPVDKESRDRLVKVLIDLVILITLKCLFIFPYYNIEPFKRGFFCNDESLMHPYHESTVQKSLGVIVFGVPLVVILTTEFICWKLNLYGPQQNIKLFNREIPRWVSNVYKNLIVFLFGMYVTLLVTDIGKRVVGRLRPHFMDVCHPVMLDGTNCTHAINLHRYIEDFKCTNNESTDDMLSEMKLSFPSGHSSLSMYAMIFTALYLQHLMTWKGSNLLKPLLQFLLVSVAWFTALSRISDYKHHWSDVLCGSCIGVAFAVIAVYGVSDIAKKREPAAPRSSTAPINAHTNAAFEAT